jgi:hypothetical protein
MSIKDILVQALRSVLGVFLGLMLISLIAEGIEFLLVALVHGSVTTDQEVYFEVRNRSALLGIEFIYNSVAGLAGGYITAWIACRAPIWHGVFLAAVQLAGFLDGMTASPYASTTRRIDRSGRHHFFSDGVEPFAGVTAGRQVECEGARLGLQHQELLVAGEAVCGAGERVLRGHGGDVLSSRAWEVNRNLPYWTYLMPICPSAKWCQSQ